MDNLSVTWIQTSLEWENINANLDNFNHILDNFKESTDLIILPEMFTTGFSMNSEKLAEDFSGKAIQFLKHQAAAHGCVITGSIIFKSGNSFFNRLIWCEANGKISHYDKHHLFALARENYSYSPGISKVIMEIKGWKILPLICYDLRFPVWSRNTDHYDLSIYIANWPEKRKTAWKTLLPARAIENQCYVVGVNRIGLDGKQISYSGDSAAYDFYGAIISESPINAEEIKTVVLNKNILDKFRADFPFLNDMDSFKFNS